jgi:hypothetical protein
MSYNNHFDMLPFELKEMIYKKAHNLLMKDLNKEFDDYVDNNKYCQCGIGCIAYDQCDCGDECISTKKYKTYFRFRPSILLNHIKTEEEENLSFSWSDSEDESEDDDF